MQKVETYYGMREAKYDIDRHIESGWRVNICTMGAYRNEYDAEDKEKVLVVYEK